MARAFHPYARSSLWCAGLAAATNGGIGLLLHLRAWFFPPVAFLNMFVTPMLALGPVCLLPSTLVLYWRPGPTAADVAARPRLHDLLSVALGFVVALGCVTAMAWLVGVAEDPLRRMIRDSWAPDRFP